jgi:cell shape-determining protein MreD
MSLGQRHWLESNSSVFVMLILTVSRVVAAQKIGVAAGSLAGLIVDFTLYKPLVFRNHE